MDNNKLNWIRHNVGLEYDAMERRNGQLAMSRTETIERVIKLDKKIDTLNDIRHAIYQVFSEV